MTIVVDASLLVRVLAFAGDEGAAARAAVAGEDWHAPHLIDLEVTSAVRRLTAAGDLEAPAADDVVRRLAAAPVERYPHTPLLGRAWELRASVTPYDASYVALAEALDCRLLTCDGRLARAPGPRCQVVLVA